MITNQTVQVVWKWDQQEPFGNNPADENPSGLGTFDLPLRLPGQYFDKETNLHYNYFRDYDPSLGIYKQSDLIGLKGGLNTYAYVAGSPLSLLDLFGLQVIGIGIEPPNSSAITGGVFNVYADPGHTFAYLLNANNQITSVVSVGPAQTISYGPFGNKTAFQNGTLPGRSNWQITGMVYTYQWNLNAQQYQQCLAVFQSVQQNPGNYSPTNQCTSAAISVAQRCGINAPNGVSPVQVAAFGQTFYTGNLPNPYGLQQQLNQIMAPTITTGSLYQQYQR